MEDPSYTAEDVASMASKLIEAGQEDAAAMLQSFFSRALIAEKEVYTLRQSVPEKSTEASGRAVTETDPPVGESLDEISQGRHVGP